MLDKQNLLSDSQSIAAAAGTVVCTNTIDLGAATTDTIGNTLTKDLGRGKRPELYAQIVEAVTSVGAATVRCELIHSDNADLSSPTVLSKTDDIAKASLVVGYRFRLSVPPGVTKRYMGLQYVIGTATTTTGKVTAGLVSDAPQSFIG